MPEVRIPAIHAGMTVFGKTYMKSDKDLSKASCPQNTDSLDLVHIPVQTIQFGADIAQTGSF
jgi:hypothetical protein